MRLASVVTAALLPGLYPDTHAHTDEAVNLGRATEWVEASEGVTRGVGGKVFLAGANAIAFTLWQHLTTG